MMTYKLLESHIYCILLSISNSKKKWQQKKSLEKHRPPAVTSIWGMAPSPNLHDQLPSVVASCHLCRPARGLPPCRFRCSPRQTKKKTVGSLRIWTNQKKKFNKIRVPRNKLSIHGEGCCLAILGGGLSWYQPGPWKFWKLPISFGKPPWNLTKGWRNTNILRDFQITSWWLIAGHWWKNLLYSHWGSFSPRFWGHKFPPKKCLKPRGWSARTHL